MHRRILLFALLIAGLQPVTSADAGCNVIAATERPFPSTLGAVTTPFARPGDLVGIRAASAAFTEDPAGNTITLRFGMPGAAPRVVRQVAATAPADPPADRAPCSRDRCHDARCSCVQFEFPDTDDAVGTPTDGTTLTGPLEITVETDGAEVARIDRLLLPGTTIDDPTFHTFVALPRATDFQALTIAPGPVAGAVDAHGDLLIPLYFRSLVPDGAQRTRFIDADTNGLAAVGNDQIEVYTTTGQRLPPLARRVGDHAVVGTVDSPESVLRIALGTLLPSPDGAAFMVPNVTAAADPTKRAVPVTLSVGNRFAVYENRECNPLVDAIGECLDLDGDGDQNEHFLMALDLTTPHATPITINKVRGEDYPGWPACVSPVGIYSFQASDSLVSYSFGERANGACDVNGNGSPFEILVSGAYDLSRAEPIPLANGTPRNEAVGDVLAFSVAEGTTDGGTDVLYYYDAASGRSDPGPHRVADAAHGQFFVTRQFPEGLAGIYPTNSGIGAPFLRTFPTDMAAADGRVAFVENAFAPSIGFTGPLHVLDVSTGAVDTMATNSGELYLGSRYIAFRQTVSAATVVDLTDPSRTLHTICARPGGYADPGPVAERFVTCDMNEYVGPPGANVDLNGDGDAEDMVLRVAWPNSTGGFDERTIGAVAATGAWDLALRGDVIAVPLNENGEGRDLDGDGQVGYGDPTQPGPWVLQVVNGLSRRVSNLQLRVAGPGSSSLQFIDRGLAVITPDGKRTMLRDNDGDGHFEEEAIDTATGERGLADNCPLVANPLQEDTDGDGIGDACDPTVPGVAKRDGQQCFAEFHVASPGRVDAGASDVHCRDGEAHCDGDAVAGQCTFRLAPCPLVADDRFPSCAAGRTPLAKVGVSTKLPGAASARSAARNALAATLAGLPGAARRGATIHFDPSLAPAPVGAPTCAAPATVTVPLRGDRAGRLDVRLRLRFAGDAIHAPVSASSTLTLVCDPS